MLVERNVHGAWVIFGDIGYRQYYYCTEKQAIKSYEEEVRQLKGEQND